MVTARDLCTPLRVFSGGPESDCICCLSPDGSTLFAGSQDGFVYQWRVGDAQEHRPFSGPSTFPNPAASLKKADVEVVSECVRYVPGILPKFGSKLVWQGGGVAAVVCTGPVVLASYGEGDCAVRVWYNAMGNHVLFNRPELFAALRLPEPKPKKTPHNEEENPVERGVGRGGPKQRSVLNPKMTSQPSPTRRIFAPIYARLARSKQHKLPLLPDIIADIIWLYLGTPFDPAPLEKLLKNGRKQKKTHACPVS